MVHTSPTPMMRSSFTSSPEKRRSKIAAMETGPGPAQYRLPGTCGHMAHDPSRPQKPAYSFGRKTKQFSSMYIASHSPGPVHYVTPNITRTGLSGTPAYSIYGRPKDINLSRSPGPAVYRVQSRETQAGYSFGKRLDLSSRSTTPSPDAYTLPCLIGSNTVGKKSYPAFSLGSRPKTGGFDEDFRKTPGPGTYKVVDAQAYGSRRPEYSLKGRNFPPEPGEKRVSPGPAAYSTQKVVSSRREAPSYSFGVKHSEYIASYLEMVV